MDLVVYIVQTLDEHLSCLAHALACKHWGDYFTYFTHVIITYIIHLVIYLLSI
jgi:hypothetical protein